MNNNLKKTTKFSMCFINYNMFKNNLENNLNNIAKFVPFNKQ